MNVLNPDTFLFRNASAVQTLLACVLMLLCTGTVAGDAPGDESESAVMNVAQAILSGNYAAAQQMAEKLTDKTVLEQLNVLREMPAMVLDSFNQQHGETVTVKTANQGEVKGKVDGVHGERVRIMVPLPSGAAAKYLRYDDLTPAEKFKRLGKDDSAGLHIARGLLALQAGHTDTATSFFGKAGTALGAAMASALDAQAKQKQRQEREAAARNVYRNILRFAGLDAELPADKVGEAAKTVFLDENKLRQLHDGIEKFRREFAGTDVAVACKDALAALGMIQRKARGNLVLPTKERMETVIAKLKSDNPKQETWNIVFENENGEASLNLYDHADLENISALTGLDLRKLALGKCRKLRDISPLVGMQLEYLSVGWTQVADISVLKGMPLVSLYLSTQTLNAPAILADMPLEKLMLGGKEIRDLSFLRGKQLTYLYMIYTDVKDLTPLRDMPLQTLFLGREVRDLSPLRNKNLSYLYLSRCNQPDLRPLRGMPLQSLLMIGKELRVTPSDIRAIVEMPLKTLVLDGVRGVDDVAALGQVKTLERLVIPSDAKGIDALRSLPKLAFIDTKYKDDWPQTAEMFWRIRDFEKK